MLCILQGMSTREIAENLGVSTNTIKFHTKSIYARLGVRRRADAVTVVFSQMMGNNSLSVHNEQ